MVLFHSAVQIRMVERGAVFSVEMQHNGGRRSAEIVGLWGMVIAVAAMLRGSAALTNTVVRAVEEDSRRLHLEAALLLRFGPIWQIRLSHSNDIRAEVTGVK